MTLSSSKPDELFYFPNFNPDRNKIELEGQEAIHCSKVLRKKLREEIWLCDGHFHHIKAEISAITKKTVLLDVKQVVSYPKSIIENDPILVVGKLKNKERLEWLIEKAVELGVAAIHLVKTERAERSYLSLERVKSVAIAALKQSKRVYLPEIFEQSDLMKALKLFENKYPIIVAHEKREGYLEFEKLLSKRAVLVVGPEGGLSDEEIHQISKLNKVQFISLGEWRLRSETAAVQLLALSAQKRLAE